MAACIPICVPHLLKATSCRLCFISTFEMKCCIDYHSCLVRMLAEQKKYILPGKFAKHCSTLCLHIRLHPEAYVARETKFYCRERERERETGSCNKLLAQDRSPGGISPTIRHPRHQLNCLSPKFRL
jgi:hypothetical protein